MSILILMWEKYLERMALVERDVALKAGDQRICGESREVRIILGMWSKDVILRQ